MGQLSISWELVRTASLTPHPRLPGSEALGGGATICFHGSPGTLMPLDEMLREGGDIWTEFGMMIRRRAWGDQVGDKQGRGLEVGLNLVLDTGRLMR